MPELTVVTSDEASEPDRRFADLDARLPAPKGPPTFEDWLGHAERAEARGEPDVARSYLNLAQHADRAARRNSPEVRLEVIEGGES